MALYYKPLLLIVAVIILAFDYQVPADCKTTTSAVSIVDLDGTWQFINSNGSVKGNAVVPGCIHTDLLANKKIDDPYYGYNDIKYRWIAYDNWTYTREFMGKFAVKTNHL